MFTKKHLKCALIGCALSSVISSSTFASTQNPWSLVASLGYTNYANMVGTNGQTAIERLAVNHDIINRNDWVAGIELGVQTGNTMSLSASQANLTNLGSLPIQTTVKPMIDLLATVRKMLGTSSFFLEGKAGAAYRRWQFNNLSTVSGLSQFAPELQAGMGYQINSQASISLLYQGVYGSTPNLVTNATTGTGSVSEIPSQNGLLLSLSIAV